MTSDGISSEDWEEVHELALLVVNASDDESDRHFDRLLAYLRELILKYGELPSILATQADYANDPAESERLFLRAFDLALARGDRSNVLEISLSLANHYARDLRRLGDASRWLEIANVYIRPDSEMDRSEYQDIEDTIARLKSGRVISGNEDLSELQSKQESAKRLVLTRQALLQFIERFLAHSLTASELQEFGEFFEGEAVEYDDESEDRVVAQVVFEMSVPEANGPIDSNAAARWSEMLRLLKRQP